MADYTALDRPVWHAACSLWQDICTTQDGALRVLPDYGPFGATEDLDNLSGLVGLAQHYGPIWLVETQGNLTIPQGLVVDRQAELVQMVAPKLADEVRSWATAAKTEPLVPDRDATEMRALALLTEPGPFGPATHGLGPFFGIRRAGRIVAMAG